MPLVQALNTSNMAVRHALKSAGFLKVSKKVLNHFKAAIVPIIDSRLMVSDLKDTLQDIIKTLSIARPIISKDIFDALYALTTRIHKKMDTLRTTFTHNIADGYDLIVSDLHAIIESALPMKYKEVNKSIE